MRRPGIIHKLLERGEEERVSAICTQFEKGKEDASIPYFQKKKLFPRQPHQKTAPTRDGEDGNNASPAQCSQKSCIAIGGEIVPGRSAF